MGKANVYTKSSSTEITECSGRTNIIFPEEIKSIINDALLSTTSKKVY